MSRDIRSFFTVVSKKTGTGNSNERSEKPIHEKVKKKPQVIVDSDEDIIESPQDDKRKTASKRKVHVISSDSEDETKSKLKSHRKLWNCKNDDDSKLKPVNIDDVFGNTPIKQSKVEPLPESKKVENGQSDNKKKKKKPKTEIGIHGDVDFEKTLLDLDDDLLVDNMDILDKTIEEAWQNKDENRRHSQNDSQIAEDSTPSKSNKKRQRKNSGGGSENKKAKLDHTDSGIDPDQEAFEKKRYSAMLYQKYKNRGGPKHHGEKEIPQGKPDCLKGSTFLRTGVLDSLEGDEFENLIKEHGGRVVHGVSRKVSYLVVGDDPGPSKLDKARGLNIPEITENDLLDMILVKSGMKAKFNKSISEVSVESGIATEEESSPKPKKKHTSHKEKEKLEVQHEKVKESGSSSKSKLNDDKSKTKKFPENDVNATKAKNQEIKEEKREHQKKPVKLQITKSNDLPQIERPKVEISGNTMCWTEKYKPKDIKSIIGQQGDKSNMHKLKHWLENWHKNQQPNEHKKIPRPSPWAKNDDGAYYKAALLSGSPGVGKTTTATLVAKELGLDIVEFNASDTRSKRLLHEEVSQLLSTTTIAGFAAGAKTTSQKRILLMDEVDGMAGNEDRGGMQELINLIKNSNIPIICMCNDRNHQKIRALVNYCFDLRFQKPRLEQIRGAMMSICFKEGINISPAALSEIINGTGCDIRQTLNHLSVWSAADKNVSLETAQRESKASKKDTVLGPWEVVKMVFSESEQKNMSLSDKSRLFFYDYSFGPLFVQENYLNITPNCKKEDVMKRVALAADAISMGDIIDSKIRGSNNWSLLESQAMYSTVLPGYYMSGHVSNRINFPSWLGKNSSANKRKRMLSELYTHTRTSTSGDKSALNLDYLVPLRNGIVYPLKKYGIDGIHQAMEVMKSYNLLREDLNNLLELCQWKDTKNPFNDVDAKVKSAFTRTYNKEAHLLPFAAGGVSKKKASALDTDLLLEDDENVQSDVEEDDDITADASIKVKTKNESKAKKDSSKASTSKAKDVSKGGKGKGKKLSSSGNRFVCFV